MTVWIVLSCIPYEGCTFEGVFSTKDRAEAYVGAADEWERSLMSVHGCVVDDPEAEVPE